MKITVNWNYCDGNGVCAVEAPTVFAIDDEGDLQLLQEHVDEAVLPAVEAAVRACPKHALAIER